MTTMLEKMAEAIWNACDDWGPFSAALPSERAEFASKVARAALLAIREPDEAMLKPFAYLESWQMPDTKGRWTAMIDTILGEKPEAQPEPQWVEYVVSRGEPPKGP
jgi:hypothetical protein